MDLDLIQLTIYKSADQLDNIKEFNELCFDLNELKELSTQLNTLIVYHNKPISAINYNVEQSNAFYENGINNLKQASNYYSFVRTSLITGVILINAPIAIYCSIKLALITTASSITMSYFSL